MENASKALIMAAGVLIGILILTLAVYLFSSFGSNSAEIYAKNEEAQLNQFNTQFTSYIGTDITIYDVITVANLATDNNIFYEFTKRNTSEGKDNYISVTLNGQSIEYGFGTNSTTINKKNNECIQEDIYNMKETGTLKKYQCDVKISPITKRVYKVDFRDIN